ncbi:MAG: hypothetical protein DHS20C21_06690 [Gemmatimonadota bacterium]|nr:MAG: hypothetical protein DHS20C21_06690 [Gemmatimonadota bacterium]
MAQRILLLDSDPGEGALLCRHLDRIPGLRYDFRQFTEAGPALREFDAIQPHVVFVNDLLEDMCPVEAVRRLRTVAPARAIVVLGNTRDADLAVRLIHAGADEYVRKGHLDGARLLEVIEQAEARSLRRHVERDLHARAHQLSDMLERESLAMRELEIAMERVEAASQAKSAFLANVSHEIRTPLTAILGYADEILRDDLPPAERREAAHIIRRNGDFLLRIVNDLLDLSKIEAGGLEIERVRFSPFQLIDDVECSFRAVARERALEWSSAVVGSLPETIESDPTRVRQVLVNLVGNALKFTERGSVGVRVQLREEAGAEPMLCFQVTDTGIGMTPDEIARIFQPFTQADGSTTRRFGGTGLGLTICERLVHRLGGDIHVQSRPGEGSTFTFAIPIGSQEGVPRSTAEEAQAQRRATPTAAPVKERTLPACHLLLADDNPVNLRLISRILERMGARVTTAATGAEAVSVAWQEGRNGRAVDLILMDLQMPDLDGWDAVTQLRDAGWPGPIVALTGNALPEERKRCLASGFDGFMTKPIRRAELHALLNEHLANGPSAPDRGSESSRAKPS